MDSKVIASARAALAPVRSGMSVMIGGFAVIHGWPNTLLRALAESEVRDLTVIANNLGFGAHSPQVLVERRQVRRLIASFGGFIGRATEAEQQIQDGLIDFEMVPQGTLVERIRAGGAGIAAFYTPTGSGTVVDSDEKERRDFDGRPHLLERALRADVALLRASEADESGNLRFAGAQQNFNLAMATAADYVVVEVDRIVPAGALPPEAVHLPGIYVDAVVADEIPRDQVMREVLGLGRDPTRGDRPALESLGLPRDLMALRAARLIQEAGYRYVNLGIGLPTLVGGWLREVGSDALLQAENGLLGYASVDEIADWDPDYYNAGGQPVAPLPGAAVFDSAAAFAMARGGHLDAVVLGAFEVSQHGDLANWRVPSRGVGGIGGAMDLIAGGTPLIVVMEHTTPSGEPRLVTQCRYPLTGQRCVTTIVTNLALIDPAPDGLRLRELAPGVSVEQVRAATGCPIAIPADPPPMAL